MGAIFYDGHILTTDDYNDGYSAVRAIEKYEEEQKNKMLQNFVPTYDFEASVCRIVTDMLIEQGLMERPEIVVDDKEKEKWKAIREYVGVEE